MTYVDDENCRGPAAVTRIRSRRDGTAGNEAEIDAIILELNSYLRSIQQ